ncbi:hypothetical protein KDM41_09340 [bacterium]|nr:hypothetical protein [bacterium]
MRDGMTVIRTYLNMAEAELGRAQLEAMEIPALLVADNCGGMRPHMDLSGGVHLLVPDHEATAARALLEEAADGPATPAWTCPGCGEEIEAGFAACWQCGFARS